MRGTCPAFQTVFRIFGNTAFSLGGSAVVRELLRASGFTAIDFAEVHETVFYGWDVDSAFDALSGFQFVKNALARKDSAADKASQRLRDMLERRLTPEGGLFDPRARIVSTRRAAE